MNAKRFLPLALLAATEDGRIERRSRVQKLAFLTQDRLDTDVYEFVPHDYGPFSDGLSAELDTLAADGLVERVETRTFGGDRRYDHRLTPAGRNAYEAARAGSTRSTDSDRSSPTDDTTRTSPDHTTPTDPDDESVVSDTVSVEAIDAAAATVADEFGELPVSNLIGYVFDEYPAYAEHSVLYS